MPETLKTNIEFVDLSGGFQGKPGRYLNLTQLLAIVSWLSEDKNGIKELQRHLIDLSLK